MQQSYVTVRSGLEHLANMVAALPLPGGPSSGVPPSALAADEEAMGEVLAQCEQRLLGAQRCGVGVCGWMCVCVCVCVCRCVGVCVCVGV